MDTLVVMRRPLRKPANHKARFIKPVPTNTSKLPIVEKSSPLMPPEPEQPRISFVSLYNDLCLCRGDGRPKSAAGRMKVDAATESEFSWTTLQQIWSESANSVLRAYLSRARGGTAGAAGGRRRLTAEVVLEIGYETDNQK